ncbi:CHAT domain-containing protein [Streptomyces sp. SID12501]|uniref:CHAT domain-containing protein n=1 Tax=Streptomyces sp. SID12501 TaxID=2706042 RepID=A0A6B3C0N2_9ACTN|nr:CHAT domain-containing protein [Streptomyces sp. SID12501]
MAQHDVTAVLDPAATEAARRLSALLSDDDYDVRARYALAWFHWYRSVALADEQARGHREAAVALFTLCFVSGVHDIPPPLLPDVADAVQPVARTALQQAVDAQHPGLLTAAVTLWQSVVTVTRADHPDLPERLSNLGIALAGRYRKTGEPDDLAAAVVAGRAAVDATAIDHPRAPGRLVNLGNALIAQYKRTDAVADIDAAIAVARAGVNAALSGHPDRAANLTHLSLALSARFERTGNAEDLLTAIEAGREALLITPDGHPHRPALLSNLGGALRARFELTQDPADLDATLEADQAALNATPDDHPDRATRLLNLATTLRLRSEARGDAAALDAAVEAHRAALSDIPDNDPVRAESLSNLAVALERRYRLNGALADLNGAVEAMRAAVAAIRADHVTWAGSQSNLALTLTTRFARLGHRADIDEAVEAARNAVDATPEGSPRRAGRLSNLAMALESRFGRFGGKSDIGEAVEAARRAVDDTPSGHPDQVKWLANLAGALRERAARSGAARDMDEAVDTARAALSAATRERDHPHRDEAQLTFGLALSVRYASARAEADRDVASTVLAGVLERATAVPLLRVFSGITAAQLIAPSNLGRASDLLEHAITLLPLLTPRHLQRGDQQHALAIFTGLPAESAAHALSDGRRSEDRRAARALHLLETGRAVLLNQSVDTRSDLSALRREHPQLAARFVELRDLLDSLPDTMSADAEETSPWLHRSADQRRNITAEFETTLTLIRDIDGYADFALPLSEEELIAQTKDGPIVALNVSTYRSDALLLTADGIRSLELPGLPRSEVVERITAFRQALRSATDGTTPTSRRRAQADITDTLAWLWDAVAEPVLRALGHHGPPPTGAVWPRIWWAPGGLLSVLPLHAAGHHSDPSDDPRCRTVMDRVVSSYTPTVRSLRHARRTAGTTTEYVQDRALIVAMPVTPGVPGRLEHVPAEVSIVGDLLPHHVLLMEKERGRYADSDTARDNRTVAQDLRPTGENVLSHLPRSSIVHFACHGDDHPSDPSLSRLLLLDHDTSPLTVAQLAQLKLGHARLAYLSACGTALSAVPELWDEAIHLTSAFHMAGFAHVVGTLWEINDAYACRFAERFYKYLFAQGKALATENSALALHHAVRAARDELARLPSFWAAYLHVGA